MNDQKTDTDAAAAHDLLSELRTRITTQPLPYQFGVEARALESLWEVFGHARAAMKRHPGCSRFAALATEFLNVDLRPVTAKWHRAYERGALRSRDGADEFRADLARVQEKLRAFALELQSLAYGAAQPDALTPPVMSRADLDALCAEVAYGIDSNSMIGDDVVQSINQEERAEIEARRAACGIAGAGATNAVGLALSGGGIRSATFCLGVIQVLAARDMLKHVDYLSTVSGGGYVGSFLTRRLGTGSSYAAVAGPLGPDPEPVRYLRHHAKYLTAVDLKQKWSMVTATLAGMLLNWSAPLLVVVLAAIAAGRVSEWFGNFWPAAFGVLSASSLFLLVVYGVLIRRRPRAARIGGALLGSALALTLLIAVGWALWLGRSWRGAGSLTWTLSGLFAALVAAGPAILRFVPVLETPKIRRIMLKLALCLVGLIMPISALVLFYAACNLAALPAAPASQWWHPLHYANGEELLLAMAAGLFIVAVAVLNINLTAPHRMYRDLLAATFIQTSAADAAPVALREINEARKAPYHLINTTVNLPSSRNAALRDRKADFFVFSKKWCGSPVTGYKKTDEWRMNAAPADLATAMAISGAAVSSYMGLGSKPALVGLLTFLNIRLGFWIRQPGTGYPQTPGFTCLLREMTGIGMSEKRPWLNLSDGGHIENLGGYELLRRRCKYVLCVDGEADPAFAYQGLMTLVRHAQLDFGIRIEPALDDLRPDPASGYCQSHATLCRIHYPPALDGRPAATGLLLYLKLSVTGNESELIRRYRRLNPEFPHQSTLDQFFGEEQFEAYRELGVHVAEGMFSRVLMGGPATGPPASAAEWFRRLAGNLLVPCGA